MILVDQACRDIYIQTIIWKGLINNARLEHLQMIDATLVVSLNPLGNMQYLLSNSSATAAHISYSCAVQNHTTGEYRCSSQIFIILPQIKGCPWETGAGIVQRVHLVSHISVTKFTFIHPRSENR